MTPASRTPNPVGDANSLADRITLRPYRGPQDHPEMRRVANLVRAANGDSLIGSVAETDAFYARFDPVDIIEDCALAELDGSLVAYARATWDLLGTGEGVVGAIFAIDPAVAGRGLEPLLIGHIVRRGAALIRERGTDRTCVLRVFVGDRLAEQRQALEAAGFRVVRAGAQLVRPSLDAIPEIPLPDGFEIRPISRSDDAMIRRVWEADARGFAESWGEEAPTERAFEAWLASPAFDPPLWRVAFHGSAIAGQILNYLGEPEPDGGRVGWTEAISVQPEFRRRGLARALLAASLRAVRDAGATRAGLSVDSQNPNQAQALYESLGYRVISVTLTYELEPFEPGAAVTR